MAPESLLKTLDKELPWSITITVKNFFSRFLFFISPIDKEVKKLRELVNIAKKNSEDKQYEVYYNEHFIQTKKTDCTIETSEAVIHHLLNPLKEDKFLLGKSKTILRELLRKHEGSDWKPHLRDYLFSIDSDDRLIFARELILDSIKADKMKPYVLFVIDQLNFSIPTLEEKLFNQLKTDDDLACYSHYLMILGDSYRSDLLDELDNLGRQKADDSNETYAVQLGFIQLKHCLRQTADNKATYQHDEVFGQFSRLFNTWKDKLIINNNTQIIITKITSILTLLASISEAFHQSPNLVRYIKAKEDKFRAGVELFDERRQFQNLLALGLIPSASIQRLTELFPDSKDRQKIISQLGHCNVFDGNNKEARDKAISDFQSARAGLEDINNVDFGAGAMSAMMSSC